MNTRLLLLVFCLAFSYFIYDLSAQETESIRDKEAFAFADLKGGHFPKPIGLVNDFENLFTEEQVKELTKVLKLYEQKTTNEIVIVTIPSIDTYSDFEQYAIDLSNSWGVGKKEKNNGLTIVFSKPLMKIRVSTGIGTERVLTDELCKSIIDQLMVPEFKKGKYYEGTMMGLAELMKQWK